MKIHKVVRIRNNCAPQVHTPRVVVPDTCLIDIVAEWTGLYDINQVPIADGHMTTHGEVYYNDGSWYVTDTYRLSQKFIDSMELRILGHVSEKQKLDFNKYYINGNNIRIHILADVAPDMAKCTQICEFDDGTISKVPQGRYWTEITREEFLR